MDNLDEENVEEELNEQDDEETLGEYIGSRNKAGQRHGNGWALLPNGDIYKGRYQKGLRHGQGVYVFNNGARYLGQYKKGEKSGNGKFFYPDGSTYDGQWRNNMKHGFGIYLYPNSDEYQGSWYNDQKHGIGTYLYRLENLKFYGTFLNGKRDGPAELITNAYRFHCNWKNDYPVGASVFNFNCKFMLRGHVDFVEKQLSIYDNDDNLKYETIWHGGEVEKYDFAKLPREPIPVPIDDEEEEEGEEEEEEEEMEEVEEEQTENDNQIENKNEDLNKAQPIQFSEKR